MSTAPERRCAICDIDISHKSPAAKTCTRAHKERLSRQNKLARMHGVGEAAKNAVAATVQESIKAYVNREVLTDDLLGRIKDMVGLTPAAIATLERLLDSEEDEMAVRAATTILRYTMGNPSVAPPSVEQAPSPMTIAFNLPRPGDEVAATVTASVETRMCGDCHVAKSVDEFVAGSNRCQRCFDDIQDGVRTKLAPKDER